jgi:hypothetical protein
MRACDYSDRNFKSTTLASDPSPHLLTAAQSHEGDRRRLRFVYQIRGSLRRDCASLLPISSSTLPLVPRTRSSHTLCCKGGCELRVQKGH